MDGTEFALATPSTPVMRVLELSGTEAMFSILESAAGGGGVAGIGPTGGRRIFGAVAD